MELAKAYKPEFEANSGIADTYRLRTEITERDIDEISPEFCEELADLTDSLLFQMNECKCGDAFMDAWDLQAREALEEPLLIEDGGRYDVISGSAQVTLYQQMGFERFPAKIIKGVPMKAPVKAQPDYEIHFEEVA